MRATTGERNPINAMLNKIAASKHFKLDQSWLRRAALSWLMLETEKKPEHWNTVMISKVCRRFRVGDAFAFYLAHPEFWN